MKSIIKKTMFTLFLGVYLFTTSVNTCCNMNILFCTENDIDVCSYNVTESFHEKETKEK